MKLDHTLAPLTRGLLALGSLTWVLNSPDLMAGPGYTPVRDVDNGIVNPFATEIAWFTGTSGGFNETASYTVPANKRLEINEISGEAYGPGSTGVIMKMTVTCGGATVTHYITNFATSTVYGNYWLMTLTSHHIDVDPGTTITVDVIRQTPPPQSTGYYSDVILTGRMTNL